MRRLALAVALACVLSGVARAGDMHSTGAVALPSPPPSTVTAAGEIPTTGAPQQSDTLVTIILTIIGIVQ